MALGIPDMRSVFVGDSLKHEAKSTTRFSGVAILRKTDKKFTQG